MGTAGGAPTKTTVRRLRRIGDALTPREWARVGAMAGVVIGLYVVGFVMLGAAIPHHYRLAGKENWLTVLKACPVSPEDVPPRRRAPARRRKL